MTDRYLNLRIGAPARLASLRLDALKLAADPHRNMHVAAKPTWRTVRYTTFRSNDRGLSCGLNDDQPIWYTHAGPAFDRERWADECDGVRIENTGWYADPDGDNTYRGLVVTLPHGRFIAGYHVSGSGERVYFPTLFEDMTDAARFADSRAEWYAEQERDYQQHWREAQDLQNAIGDKLNRLRECLALRNNKCFRRLRDEVIQLTQDIRDARETLKREYADADV